MRTIELPITERYVSNWDYWDALRELLQNAIDSNEVWRIKHVDKGIPGEFVSFELSQDNTILPIDSLLLGNSTKVNDGNSIGGFGEGYKLALLVLVRKGCEVTIFNGRERWDVRLRSSQTFNANTLHIDITDSPRVNNSILEIHIEYLPKHAIIELQSKYIPREGFNFERYQIVNYGDILTAERFKGKLFVGGLFISEMDTAYGYNILPQHIQLERDRKTVDYFDFKCLAQKMWLMTRRFEEIAELIEEEIPEFDGINYRDGIEVLQDYFAKKIQNEYPNRMPIAAYERDTYFKRGYKESDLVVVNSEIADLAKASVTYPKVTVAVKTIPQITLENWYIKHKKGMNNITRLKFKELINAAFNWNKT